ncbi:MAG: DUF3431 domain-containing protein [Methylacidiphilales bacterium]|nr:DUF3431 domain-containing protein [Candidatus Methylacidiphilales bacterium]
MIDLVVARYAEDVSWMGNIPAAVRVHLYNKGKTLPGGIDLPNAGREAHTYLHHIVTQYEHLADLTVFCQGKPFDHAHDFHRVLRDLNSGARAVENFLWLGFLIDTDDKNGRRLFVPWSKNPGRCELPMEEFYTALFGQECPEGFRFYAGAQFAVTSACIRGRPRSFYERVLELALRMELAPHCLERVWDRVFGVTGAADEILDGKETVYLKPIKRLIAPSES